MRILVFGPSGSGKTYVSTVLQSAGYAAVDADSVEGLSAWYDSSGNKVAYPNDADEDFLNNHNFLWNKEFLANYLKDINDIYLFGMSGNVYDMLDLFDKSFYLKVDADLQKDRLQHESRLNPMGNTEYHRDNAVVWGLEMEEKAKNLNIPLIDARLDPFKIFAIIRD
jgi:hypothetical protein